MAKARHKSSKARSKRVATQRRSVKRKRKAPAKRVSARKKLAARKKRARKIPAKRSRRASIPKIRIRRVPLADPVGDLDLVDYAAEAARLLLKEHPKIVFTSGRRDIADQARAMAPNIVANRQYIKDTYSQSPQRDQLQAWVDAHPEAKTAKQIETGLLEIMTKWTDAQKATFSKHFSGEAFDVQPVSGAPGEAIKTTIWSLPNLRKFLEKEAGLVRWHADFNKPAGPTPVLIS